MSNLKERYAHVTDAVAQACVDCGRNPEDVVVMGVSKTVGVDVVAEAIEAGVTDFGENRPEQLVEKHDLYPQVRWHFIGNIQSRQLRNIVGRACCIHSLYKVEHAQKIDALAADQNIVQHVLIEVNDGEDNKQGINREDLYGMLKACCEMEHISVDGLMIMAPQADDKMVSAVFAGLKSLRDEMVTRLRNEGLDCELSTLSMGMSNDYPLAIAEGSTIVRVGRAIFSDTYSENN